MCVCVCVCVCVRDVNTGGCVRVMVYEPAQLADKRRLGEVMARMVNP